MVQTLTHPIAGAIQALGVPIKLSDTPGQIRMPPPTLGQHTEEVLAGDLGLDGAAIARLRAGGVI
jgi:crotonobetainyl-CoA:carnitine CoA-transferase CaiB-like acyl-CoA transferase